MGFKLSFGASAFALLSLSLVSTAARAETVADPIEGCEGVLERTSGLVLSEDSARSGATLTQAAAFARQTAATPRATLSDLTKRGGELRQWVFAGDHAADLELREVQAQIYDLFAKDNAGRAEREETRAKEYGTTYPEAVKGHLRRADELRQVEAAARQLSKGMRSGGAIPSPVVAAIGDSMATDNLNFGSMFATLLMNAVHPSLVTVMDLYLQDLRIPLYVRGVIAGRWYSGLFDQNSVAKSRAAQAAVESSDEIAALEERMQDRSWERSRQKEMVEPSAVASIIKGADADARFELLTAFRQNKIEVTPELRAAVIKVIDDLAVPAMDRLTLAKWTGDRELINVANSEVARSLYGE